MKKIKIIENIFSIISIIVCIASNAINGYQYLFFVPISYLLCNIFNTISKYNKKINIGYIAIDVIAFVKYSLMPLLIVMMKDYYNGVLTGQTPREEDIIEAIVLMCIECFTVFISIAIFNKYNKKSTLKEQIEVDNSSKYNVKFGLIMLVIFVISGGLVFKYSNAFFPSQLFIIDSNYQSSEIDASLDGLVMILFYLLKVFFLLFVTQYFITKYRQKEKFIYVIGIIVALLVYLGLNLSTSRWNLIIPLLVYLYIIKDILLKNITNKLMIAIVGVILIISFISISVYKFDWMFKKDTISIQEVTTVLSSEIQEYFSGPRAIAQGIETKEIYNDSISLQTLINDFTGSIPFFSKFVNQDNRINVYYNYFLKGKNAVATQIMPMISISLAYFSYPLCYIFTAICIILSLRFGNKVENKKDIFRKYIYSYASVWLAMCMGFNTQIIFGWFMASFLPFILVIYFNEKIVLKSLK